MVHLWSFNEDYYYYLFYLYYCYYNITTRIMLCLWETHAKITSTLSCPNVTTTTQKKRTGIQNNVQYTLCCYLIIITSTMGTFS